LEVSLEKSEKMEFLGQHPVRCKVIVDNKCLQQAKNFRYIGCERSYENVKDQAKHSALQAWSGPEGSRKLRLADFMTRAQDGGKVVSLTHRPILPPRNTPGTHFC